MWYVSCVLLLIYTTPYPLTFFLLGMVWDSHLFFYVGLRPEPRAEYGLPITGSTSISSTTRFIRRNSQTSCDSINGATRLVEPSLTRMLLDVICYECAGLIRQRSQCLESTP